MKVRIDEGSRGSYVKGAESRFLTEFMSKTPKFPGVSEVTKYRRILTTTEST